MPVSSASMHRLLTGWIMAAAAACLIAQTKVDLRTQSKSVDFSAASLTKPVRTGTSLPATCSASEMFYLTSATPGYNLYYCTASNIWTPARASAQKYTQSFTAQTSVSITAATHNLSTGDLAVTCYDAGSPKTRVEPDRVQVDAANTVTITFFAAQTGRCILQ